MSKDREFYSRRVQEELQLADAASCAEIRRVHVRRAREYDCFLPRSSVKNAPDEFAQWKLRKRSEVFGDWLADVM